MVLAAVAASHQGLLQLDPAGACLWQTAVQPLSWEAYWHLTRRQKFGEDRDDEGARHHGAQLADEVNSVVVWPAEAPQGWHVITRTLRLRCSWGGGGGAGGQQASLQLPYAAAGQQASLRLPHAMVVAMERASIDRLFRSCEHTALLASQPLSLEALFAGSPKPMGT